MNRIRNLRKEKHLSQTQLGDMVNASQQTISKIENSARNDFSCDLLCSLCDFFQVSADYILGRTEERKTPLALSACERDSLESACRRLSSYDRKMLLSVARLLENRPPGS